MSAKRDNVVRGIMTHHDKMLKYANQLEAEIASDDDDISDLFQALHLIRIVCRNLSSIYVT